MRIILYPNDQSSSPGFCQLLNADFNEKSLLFSIRPTARDNFTPISGLGKGPQVLRTSFLVLFLLLSDFQFKALSIRNRS